MILHHTKGMRCPSACFEGTGYHASLLAPPGALGGKDFSLVVFYHHRSWKILAFFVHIVQQIQQSTITKCAFVSYWCIYHVSYLYHDASHQMVKLLVSAASASCELTLMLMVCSWMWYCHPSGDAMDKWQASRDHVIIFIYRMQRGLLSPDQNYYVIN